MLPPAVSSSLLRFNESIHSEYTRQNYHYHLRKFSDYVGIRACEELLSLSQQELQSSLERYLASLKLKTNPNSIPTMFLGIRHFLVMNRVRVDWEIIRKMYPKKTVQSGTRPWSKDDIQKILGAAANIRDGALVRFLASTGIRIGGIDHDLRILNTRRMPHGCTAVTIYAGTVDEYWAFLTPAASLALWGYVKKRARDGEGITAQSPLFRNLYCKTTARHAKQLRWSGARSLVYRLVLRANVHRTRRGNRYDVQIDHGFRKYFNTTLKLNSSVNSNVAEKLMGHKNGLDGTYLRPDREQCFREFRKAVSDLELCP